MTKLMNYYFSKKIEGNINQIISKVTEELKKEGFGVITEINVRQTMKEKLNIDYKDYRILGACNPAFAYKALQAEDKIGTMLPCNVIIEEVPGGMVEVAAINPMASMELLKNHRLNDIAAEVSMKLEKVVENL